MLKFEYDNIRKIATAEFIPTISITEANNDANVDIYGFVVQIRPSPNGGVRNFGNDGYFKVYKMKKNSPVKAAPIQVVRIYFTRPQCVKHKPMIQNWKLKGKDKSNINDYLNTEIGKLDPELNIPKYKGMILYSFLILIADKLCIGVGREPSIHDDRIIQRSLENPTLVLNDFISIYYPKPDYSKMEYIN